MPSAEESPEIEACTDCCDWAFLKCNSGCATLAVQFGGVLMWSVPVEAPSENFSASSSTVKLLAWASGTTRVAELKASENAGSTASARRLPGAVVATALISPGKSYRV